MKVLHKQLISGMCGLFKDHHLYEVQGLIQKTPKLKAAIFAASADEPRPQIEVYDSSMFSLTTRHIPYTDQCLHVSHTKNLFWDKTLQIPEDSPYTLQFLVRFTLSWKIIAHLFVRGDIQDTPTLIFGVNLAATSSKKTHPFFIRSEMEGGIKVWD